MSFNEKKTILLPNVSTPFAGRQYKFQVKYFLSPNTCFNGWLNILRFAFIRKACI